MKSEAVPVKSFAQEQLERKRSRMSKYQHLEIYWKKLALILMPTVLALNLFINISENYSPRIDIDNFNYPEVVLQILLLFLGYIAVIKSVKTVMLFTCLAYFAFGLMFAYEEVLRETRTVMNTAPTGWDDPPKMMKLEPPYT